MQLTDCDCFLSRDVVGRPDVIPHRTAIWWDTQELTTAPIHCNSDRGNIAYYKLRNLKPAFILGNEAKYSSCLIIGKIGARLTSLVLPLSMTLPSASQNKQLYYDAADKARCVGQKYSEFLFLSITRLESSYKIRTDWMKRRAAKLI
jgi:hypothetical protein